MTKRTAPFSPELCERAVRTVRDHEGEHGSQWSAIQSITARIACSGETLRNWVRQSQRDQGMRPGRTTDEGEPIKALERENRELRQANAILRKAPAYFDSAELDWYNHRRLLAPIGNVPPAEAEARYHTHVGDQALAA